MTQELKPVVLAEMVEYQNDAIVSKTIVEKNTGTVTIFAFDQGQGLSEHTAPFDAMVQVLDGEVEIRISGNPFHLQHGEMIVMPYIQFTKRDVVNGLNLKNITIYDGLFEADAFINVPIAKTHSLAKLTLGMKNLMGIVWDRRYWHRNDLQQCIQVHPNPAKRFTQELDCRMHQQAVARCYA